MDYTHHYHSPMGEITMASDGDALIGLWFDGQRHYADTLSPEHEEKHLPIFGETEKWLDLYFDGKVPGFTPAINMKTTPFRKSVWDILLTIPYGQTMTYGQIAAQMARKAGIPRMSAQAVGGAVGHNSISIIIPCHRVVGTDGSLTGYSGGIEKKLKLLELEGVDIEKLLLPWKPTAADR